MIKSTNSNTLIFFALAGLSISAPALADSTAVVVPEAVAPVASTTSSLVDTNPSYNEHLDDFGYQPNSAATAQSDLEDEQEQGWVDDRREDVQTRLQDWAHKMDGWFGETDPDEPAKASLRVVLDTRWEDDPKTGSDVTVEPRIRGSLRLPVLQRRLSVLIGDEDLDEDTFLKQGSIDDTYQSVDSEDQLIDSSKIRDDNASIALRWSRFTDDIENQLGIRTDIDVGVRSLDDPFIKVSFDKDWYEGDTFNISTDSYYRYGLDSKHYAKGALDLQYSESDNRFINNRVTVRYLNDDDGEQKDWRNDLRQVHYFGNEKQLSYGMTASGFFESGELELNSYGPSISYRQPIWREWLYVQTQLNYYNDKAEDKDHYPSALLRLEALF